MKIFSLKKLLILTLLGLSANLSAQEIVISDFYSKIKPVAENPLTVREFYSFWCGHCYALQPIMDHVEDRLIAKGVTVIKNPIAELGGDLGLYSVYAIVVAEKLNVEREFRHRLFKLIHEDHHMPQTPTEINKIFLDINWKIH